MSKDDGLLGNKSGVIRGNDTVGPIGILNGPCNIAFAGNFDGATLTIEHSVDSTFNPLLDETIPVVYTEPNLFAYNLFTGDSIRFVVTGSGSQTEIRYGVTFN